MISNLELFYSYEMKINNDYQKRKGQITTIPIGEIIKPKRKYLVINWFNPLWNFFRESLEQYRKINRSSKFAKKDPFNGAFYGFTKSSVSLFPLFRKPLLHTFKIYAKKLFSVDGTNGMLLNCHMCQFSISGHKTIKKLI